MKRRSFTVGLGLLLLFAGIASAGPQARADGLWAGVIILHPAQVEFNVTVEIAGDPLVGTIDLPALALRFHHLQNIKPDGSRIVFDFDRSPDNPDADDTFHFSGEVSPDGQEITGEFSGRFLGTELRLPFLLARQGDAGSERPPEEIPPLTVFSDQGNELQQAFNNDRSMVRLVLFLSPTCPSCLGIAGVVQRYVLDTIGDDDLRTYVIWGPMIGDEREEHARAATTFLPDSRAKHFWTATNTIAEAFGKTLNGEDGLLSWSTIQLFPPGVTWTADSAPTPERLMHLNKPLPDELLFNGETLSAWVRSALPARSPPPAAPPGN